MASTINKYDETIMCFAIKWQAPLTRMYISRRKCEMVLAVAKNTTRLLG